DGEIQSLGSQQAAGDGFVADTQEMKQKILEINSNLTRYAAQERPLDMVVWPENEFMHLNDDTALYEQLSELAKELGTVIAADTVWETDGKMYDTALLMNSNGEELGRTPKIFTLWGEEDFGFSPGPRDYPVYETEFGIAALAVCWDRHDASILRGYARNGAQIALIPADDDFQGDVLFPFFAASDTVFRAVENRMAIATGSTSGLAQIVTPYGVVTAESSMNQREYIIGDTFVMDDNQTLYTKLGDWFAYLLSLLFIVMLVVS